MKITHHGLTEDLPDEWWAEAGMVDFVPHSRAYRTDQRAFGDQQILEVRIDDVGPVCRDIGVSVFNDSSEGIPARERVLSILRGFRLAETLPPVEIIEDQKGHPHRYKLVDGTHRLYCSLAAGFTHVPAVQGFDWASLSPTSASES